MEAFGRGNYCSRVVLVTANSIDDDRLIIMKSKKRWRTTGGHKQSCLPEIQKKLEIKVHLTVKRCRPRASPS